MKPVRLKFNSHELDLPAEDQIRLHMWQVNWKEETKKSLVEQAKERWRERFQRFLEWGR